MMPSFRASLIYRSRRAGMDSTLTRKSATKFVPVATYSRTRMLLQHPFGNVLFQKYAIGLHANMSAHRKLIHHATWMKPMIVTACSNTSPADGASWWRGVCGWNVWKPLEARSIMIIFTYTGKLKRPL